MLLKIGELAKRSGLTVRALHHYDAIGLLTPSARSDAGYRLYDRNDIARLYQIQALQRLGLSLADIGAYLSRPDLSLVTVVAQQIDLLSRQIEQASSLRERLSHLHGQLAQGQQPDLVDWLTTLEQMTMYDNYFSQEELKQLPLYVDAANLGQEWRTLAAAVQALMDSGVGPEDARAQALAQQWMTKVVRDTGANPVLFAKLNAMHEQEPALQQQSGISPLMMRFVIAASNQGKLAIYRRYLSDEEFAFLRDNIGKRSMEWPPLIARVRTAMDGGVAADSAEAQVLARDWLDLFRSYAGDNPQTQLKIREALNHEPGLTDTGWVDAAMREFMRDAMKSLPTH